MNLINKLANSIEKSVILHFGNEEVFDDLKDFEFDRPAIGLDSGLTKVVNFKVISSYFTKVCPLLVADIFKLSNMIMDFHILIAF